MSHQFKSTVISWGKRTYLKRSRRDNYILYGGKMKVLQPYACTALMIIFALIIADTAGFAQDNFQSKGRGRTYTGAALQEISFPIGGIGTGSISLGGRGQLRDWEIFNKPDKGSQLDFTFFAIWAQAGSKPGVARILERKSIPPYRGGGHGVSQRALSGLPRLEEAEFTGGYPFAKIKFRDPSLPVVVELEAWNPFIPLNVAESALPVAIFKWTIINPTSDPVSVSLAASMFNPIGDRYVNVKGEKPGLGMNINEYLDAGNFRGLHFSSQKVKKDDPNHGTMAVATSWKDLDVQTRWYRGGWWDQCHIFWDDFSQDGRIKELKDTLASDEGGSDVGSMVLHATIPPNGTISFSVFITWYFPNRENYWNSEPSVRGQIMRNYVAKKFNNAWEVAEYVVENLPRLEEETRSFHDALFNSTYPEYVLDAVSSQMSTLKSNVCILLEDGSFFGFEGVSDKGGCCPLNCTHVWNYEQTLAFLFPELERSMRETDFLNNTLPNGYMTFRTFIPLGENWWKFKACADGQMGCIMKAYREWKLSGDTQWLKKIWKYVKLALEFAWKGSGDPPPVGFKWTKEQIPMPWDPNRDGVMEGEQHNTYDIEFYGPNTMTGSLYLGALKAASEMAEALGEKSTAREYKNLFESGSKKYDELLWKDDYYIQKVNVLKGLEVPVHLISPEESCSPDCKKKSSLSSSDSTCKNPKYQYGEGCLSDQLLGQYLAHVVGIGYVLNPDHVRKAMKSIYDYNFKQSLSEFGNVQRVYALNDEAGLLLCSWPRGNRPALPFVYSDEVWTGIEYQVAASLIYNGWIDEGLNIVKAVRDRYNGERRNPWDEEECGHHYARAMASWAVLLSLSGYYYDGIDQEMTFVPRISKSDFRTYWSCGSGWGTFSQQKGERKSLSRLDLTYGSLQLKTLKLDSAVRSGRKVEARLNGKPVDISISENRDGVKINFGRGLKLRKNDILEIEL